MTTSATLKGASSRFHRLRVEGTKFSVTLGFKRRERMIWQRTQGHPHLWDDEQADQIIYELGYHATGWITTGDALLANTSADLARAWRDNATYADPDHDTAITTQPLAA